jgi:hypothetical protein
MLSIGFLLMFCVTLVGSSRSRSHDISGMSYSAQAGDCWLYFVLFAASSDRGQNTMPVATVNPIGTRAHRRCSANTALLPSLLS